MPSIALSPEIFRADVQFLDELWQPKSIGGDQLPVIDLCQGDPLVFVPIHEQFEFVYARQIRAFSTSRRVILYRRRESRTQFVRLVDRAEELRRVIDALGITTADFVGHGDAAMVVAEFALRYPDRCRSLVIVSLGADYRIAPHPLIWILHEVFLRLPVEHLVPAFLLRRIVMRYITHRAPRDRVKDQAHSGQAEPITEIPRALIEDQFGKISSWPALYRYSVLPLIHFFDIRPRLAALAMPILLINRWDDALAPEAKTAWLAQQLPNCVYHVVDGHGRFFMYSEAERVTPLISKFLSAR